MLVCMKTSPLWWPTWTCLTNSHELGTNFIWKQPWPLGFGFQQGAPPSASLKHTSWAKSGCLDVSASLGFESRYQHPFLSDSFTSYKYTKLIETTFDSTSILLCLLLPECFLSLLTVPMSSAAKCLNFISVWPSNDGKSMNIADGILQVTY